MNELVIGAGIENIAMVQDFISGHIEGCPPKVLNQILIAVDEIFSNIAHYAYAPAAGDVTVRVAVGDCITIEFEDQGVAFNPLTSDAPDISLAADERSAGGLGIFMVKNIMDAVSYRRADGKNILTIQKNSR